jgi:Lipocalin-like domain
VSAARTRAFAQDALDQLEWNMQTGWKSLLTNIGRGISWATLALAISLGSSGFVRAEDPEITAVSLQDTIAPIVSAVMQLDQAVADLRSAVGAFEDSFHSKHMTTRQLCISDESGAETCITKAELDVFLQAQRDAQATEAVKGADKGAAPAPAGQLVEPAPAADETDALQLRTTAATTATITPPSAHAIAPHEELADPELDETGSISPHPSAAEPSAIKPLKDQLIGSWTLLLADDVKGDNTLSAAYVPNPIGSIIFLPDGHYSLQIMRSIAQQDVLTEFGTYVANDADNTLILHVEDSSDPSLAAKQQEEQVTAITNEVLTWSSPAPVGARAGTVKTALTWTKAE